MAGLVTTLGVLADTHIPDRLPELYPAVVQIFRQAGVSAILHAGDVSVPRVLAELQQLAPVYAVRGNRDIFYLRHLPLRLELKFNGITIGMAHGHGTFPRYLLDKLKRAIWGRQSVHYLERVLKTFPKADVIVFGHTHEPVNQVVEGKLLLNPGSTTYPWPRGTPGTIALLHLELAKVPRAEIIPLT